MTDLPAIPQRLDGRPTLGGLVVPFVSVSDGVHHLLGNVHRMKALRCIQGHLCQVDGEPLIGRRVVLATAAGVAAEYTGEPALHPECAAYSVKACPMIAGRMDTYRSTPAPLDLVACTEPGCDCDGWVASPGVNSREDGDPAEEWFAVWLDTYHLATTPKMELHGLTWQGITPLRIRPV